MLAKYKAAGSRPVTCTLKTSRVMYILLSQALHGMFVNPANKDRYGRDKDFFFVWDEDGKLTLLERNRPVEIIDEDNESINYWPRNSSDGNIIYQQYFGKGAGQMVFEFMKYLGVDYLD